MKRKTMALLALGIVAALMLSPNFVQAADNSQQQFGDTYTNPNVAQGGAPIRWRTRARQRINAFASQPNNGECMNWRNRMELGLGLDDTGDVELPDLDEIDVDEFLEKYKDLLDAEDVQVKDLWILLARGRS